MADSLRSSEWTEDVERDCTIDNDCTNSKTCATGRLSALVLPTSTLMTYSYGKGAVNGHLSRGTTVKSEINSVRAALSPKLNLLISEECSCDEKERFMSGIPDRPGQKRDFSRYAQRLDSFQDGPQPWTRVNPSAQYLARIGFHHTGYEQIVQCFVCEVKISEWDDGKDPLIKHHYKSPNCSFIHQHFSSELKELLSEERVVHHNPHYSSSSYRLHSFSTWQFASMVTSFQLASAGFFYTGYGSRVECFSCGLVYEDWKKEDIPLHIHRQLRPDCSFISTLLSKESHSPTVLPPAHHLPPTPSDYPASRVPDYANMSVRIRSFKHLAKNFPVGAEVCAEAGLFFVRKPDVMKCFSCGAIVRDWVDGDVPAEKHREVSSNCSFLREFFPTKFTVDGRSDVGVSDIGGGVDPSTLPEPEFDEEDLERMSLLQHAKYEHEQNYQQMKCEFSKVSLDHRHDDLPVRAEQSLPPEPVKPSTEHGDSDNMCVICMDAPLQVVLIPCGHMCICESCSRQIIVCPMCRRSVEDSVKVFLPY